MMFRFLLVAALLLLPTASRAVTSAEKAGFSPRLLIYLAKGDANSCGAGCDHWIAIEGEVDRGAAARLRRFLAAVKDTGRPIYFHSPGGSVDESYAIARLLRGRKTVARVGRTVLAACAPGLQLDDACLKIKSGSGEVEAELTTRRAMCNSACAYMIIGATTREVAPDAAVAVHSSRLTVAFHGTPSPQQLADYRNRTMAKANRERAAFVVAMGVNRELDDLIKTVKFESLHVLTRPELYRFGIDTRSLSETAWTLESVARPYLRKIALAKRDDDGSFRLLEWHLYCENRDRARLMFVREFDQGVAPFDSVMMMAAPERAVAFGKYPARVGKYEVWSDPVTPDVMQAMLAAPRLQMGERSRAADGKTQTETFDIDTSGLQAGWNKLLESCPAAPAAARPVAVVPVIGAAAQAAPLQAPASTASPR
jgi:hypothetical protein